MTSTEATPAPKPPRRRGRLGELTGRNELTEETIFTSTRQAACLNPAVVATHPALAGPITGIDLATGQPVSTDPHELYRQGRIISPNVLVLGDISSGKSSLVKTQYCLRQVACGKQVVVLDRKNQQGRGEYERAAAELGVVPVRFARTGGTSINLLDPRISTTSESGTDGRVGQDRLLLMVAEHAHEQPLTSRQRYALRTAHHTALERARTAGRAATLHDVVDALYEPVTGTSAAPRKHLEAEGIVSREHVTLWGLDLALDLERFVTGDLSGLIDRATSSSLDLDAPLIVFDTSALPEDSPALSLVMALVATFLSAVWANRPGRRPGWNTRFTSGATPTGDWPGTADVPETLQHPGPAEDSAEHVAWPRGAASEGAIQAAGAAAPHRPLHTQLRPGLLGRPFGNAADHPERVRRYPSGMTDAEWAVVRPLLPVPGWLRGRGGSRRRTATGRYWTLSATWWTTASSGGRCRPTSRRGTGSMRSSADGATMCWSGSSTTGCAAGSAGRRGGMRSRRPG